MRLLRAEPVQRRRLLERIGRLLAPGGAFLFDVYSLAAFETWEEQVAYGRDLMDGFWSSRPYYGFLDTFRYEAERVVLEKYTVVEEPGPRASTSTGSSTTTWPA